MALNATVYSFEIELADVDRGVYGEIVLRAARHPSETAEYLLTRVLAYCLEYTEGLEMSRGLADPDGHVIDKGLGLRQVGDLLSTCSGYIDIVKLGWGTGYVTQNVTEKIAAYRDAGIPVCFGGTLLEVAILQGRFDAYRGMVRDFGVTHVEVSNGVIDLTMKEKAKYIRELAKEFTVLSRSAARTRRRSSPRTAGWS